MSGDKKLINEININKKHIDTLNAGGKKITLTEHVKMLEMYRFKSVVDPKKIDTQKAFSYLFDIYKEAEKRQE